MSSANSSLRPAWRNQSGGRGFQPPPTVASERARSASIGSSEGSERSSSRVYNKFSALNDDDDDLDTGGPGGPPPMSRLEGLRQGLAVRSASTGTKVGVSGRSLADLAATVPEKSAAATRFAREENVIRFTRERLLSMRPQPNIETPEVLLELEGSVVLAESAQDPVCFDTFDADAIWATVPARRSSSAKLTREASTGEAEAPRRPSARISSSGGRWQRGVALPPPSATAPATRRDKDSIADNPEDLWDDPVSSSGAAADFSAFGDLGDNEEGDGGGDVFDFEKMAEESRLLESELHPENESATGNGPANRAPRPLAVVGTTILSGSGEDVNVFEDFDDPANELSSAPTESTTPDSTQENNAVKSATEDPTASSRLMAMIGVNPDRAANEAEGLSLAALVGAPATVEGSTPMKSPVPGPTSALAGWGAEPNPSSAVNGLSIPLNPWGGSSLLGGPPATQPTIPTPQPQDLDLQARLREAEMQQKAREHLHRQQEMEAQKRAQQQQQQQEAQRQAGVQSQVELVLMERISTILENSWGRSDLVSVLTTLHSEDSRVIPLLNNVDALRALLMRNVNRVRLQHDHAFGTEMAVLLMTNAQWQQNQAARAQQEGMRRRIQEQEEQEAQRQRVESAARSRGNGLRPDAPWFYSDPQGNIQGPFRPEEMRQWLVAGYFKGDLPVCQNPKGPFVALSLVFPDLNSAFVFNGEPQQQQPQQQREIEMRQADEESQRRRLAEQMEANEYERKAKAAAEAAEEERRKRQAEQEVERQRRSAAADAERKAQEAAAAKGSKSNGGNESSAQLKMMLGLSMGRGGASGSPSSSLPATPTPTPVATRKVVDTNPEQPKRKSSKVPPPPPPPANEPDQASPKPQPPAASPWGSAAQPAKKKTMSEIQMEEARAAALAAQHRESSRPSGSGWANVAASKTGPSGWTSGTARAAPAAVLTRSQVSQPNAPAGSSPRTRANNNVDVAAINMQTAPQPSHTKGGKSTPADDFGAKMSPALEKWCKEQMMKINGSEDLTLVSFCMTLNDPMEIRQYLTTYLGPSPQVNSFATEFINRKVGVKPVKEEWETTVVSKKKSKKKAGR